MPHFSLVPSEGIRSFDRSFILAIAPDGSRYVLLRTLWERV